MSLPDDTAAIRRAVTDFLAAVDHGDADALRALYLPEATMFFPFADTTAAVTGQAAILARFERLFAAWRRHGKSQPYVGFAPTQFTATLLGDTHALATFVVGIDGAPGRRSVVLRRTTGGWRIEHLHASNLEARP